MIRIPLTVFGLLLVLLAVLAGTRPGLQAGLWIADRLLPGQFRATVVDGRLFDRFELRDLQYRDAAIELEVDIDTLALDWRSLALARRTLLIDNLAIGALHITARPDDAPTTVEPSPLSLPLAMEVSGFDIHKLTYHDRRSDTRLHLNQLHARVSAHHDLIAVRQLSVAGDNFIIHANGSMQLIEQWPFRIDYRYSLTLPDSAPLDGDVDGHGRVSGDLRAVTVNHQSTAPLVSNLEVSLSDFLAETPAWHGRLQAGAIELQAFTDTDGRADIDIEFHGDPGGTDLNAAATLTGDIEADWSLAAVLAHEEPGLLDITSLRLEDHGRRVELIGQGRLAPDVPEIDFAGDWRYRIDAPVTGKLRLAGTPADYRIEVTALTEAPVASSWALQASGDTGRLAIDALRGELAEGEITGRGLLDWRDEVPRFELQGGWSGLALTVEHELPVRAPGGEFKISGTAQQYAIELAGDLAAGDWPAVTLSLSAGGSGERLDITALEVRLLNGVLNAAGHAGWKPQPRLELDISGKGIDPGRHWPDWPGRLQPGTTLAAERIGDDWRISLRDFTLQGLLRGYPLQAGGDLRAGAGEYHIDQLTVHSGASLLTLDGRLGKDSRLEWQLRSPDLGQLWPEAGGRVEGHGRLHGRLPAPEVIATIAGRGIHSPWLTIDTLKAELDLDIATDRFDADIEAAGLKTADQTIDRFSIHSRGALEQHSLNAELETPTLQLGLTGTGALRDDTWNLHLERATVHERSLGEWRLSEAMALSISPEAVRIDPHCWRQQAARLCGNGAWRRAGAWSAALELAGVKLEQHMELPAEWPALSGALDSGLTASGDGPDIESIDGSLRLSAARLQPAGDIDALVIDELTLGIADTPGGTLMRLSGTLDGVYPGELQGQLRTGRLRLDPDALAATPIDGEIKAAISDLRPLLALYTDLDARQAVVNLDARIGGSLGTPELTGTLRLTAANVTIIEGGLALSEVELQVDGSPGADLMLSGLARSGPGTLAVDGRLQLSRAGIRISALNISGEEFETLNLPEAWVLTSPELQVEHVDEVIQVSGDIVVPSAMLEPLEAVGAVEVSPDEKIITPEVEEASAEPLQIAARIRLRLGDEVQIRGPGFSGRLTGALDIRQQPGQPVTAEGMLTIIDGIYSAYGQELRITTGEIIYTGQALDDPALNIRAVRSVGAIQAGVHAHGSALRPEVELFSTPPMPEADILSYLIVGRPISGLGAGEGSMLLDAAVSMGIKGTESLRQDIAGALGLDELTLTAGGPDQADTRLTVGKFLTPRLYISYGAGLVETAVDTMRLRYTINRWLVLEAEQGRGTGADVLYQLER